MLAALRKTHVYRSVVALTLAYALAAFGVASVLVAARTAAASALATDGAAVICHSVPGGASPRSDTEPPQHAGAPCCVVCAVSAGAFGPPSAVVLPGVVRVAVRRSQDASPPPTTRAAWHPRAGEARAPPR